MDDLCNRQIMTTNDADEYQAGVTGIIQGYDLADQHDGSRCMSYEILMEDGEIVKMHWREFMVLDIPAPAAD